MRAWKWEAGLRGRGRRVGRRGVDVGVKVGIEAGWGARKGVWMRWIVCSERASQAAVRCRSGMGQLQQCSRQLRVITGMIDARAVLVQRMTSCDKRRAGHWVLCRLSSEGLRAGGWIVCRT